MNAPHPTLALPSLASLAFAELAPASGDASPEAQWLAGHAAALHGDAVPGLAARWFDDAAPESDRSLAALAATLRLAPAEVLAVALCCAAETDAMAARSIAWLQAPVGGARPTVGLVVDLAARWSFADEHSDALADLAAGAARDSGLLRIDDAQRALPEAPLAVPQPIVLALGASPRLHWPGVRFALPQAPPLPASIRSAAARHAGAFSRGSVRALVVRSGQPREAQAAAAEVAAQLRARVAYLDGDPPPGIGPWLWLASAIPVLSLELSPGERRRLEPIRGWDGPILVAAGPDGSVEFEGVGVPGWRVPIPDAAERGALWQAATGDAALAESLGRRHRHAASRIAELGQAARFEAALCGAEAIGVDHVRAVARGGAGSDLGALAELMTDAIPDSALVLPPAVRGELESLADRCLARDALAGGLGPAAQARYRAGVRALLVGPSGTGKSLAVGWLATRLGLPLYRVDLASVTSKYIGETEKNLAQLFARAEHAEVVLMFDEADALFGKRTDVKDSNDRFANAQTNYLLSRIESYEGIAILTSNSRARFDSAFTRRLDAIVEFPPPGPDERRALWIAHLPAAHALPPDALNCLAAVCELAGGHIRNVVLAAAAGARIDERPLGWSDVLDALGAEYRKLGKGTPAVLAARAGAAR